MRRSLTSFVLLGLLAAMGCRHVAGLCDCADCNCHPCASYVNPYLQHGHGKVIADYPVGPAAGAPLPYGAPLPQGSPLNVTPEPTPAPQGTPAPANQPPRIMLPNSNDVSYIR